ncbi:MAG TPA: sugar phosphate isomerase/epimerase family protein, partial [Lacipirellulaceae bacterium]|nr:sugar phosphate isomerase/epimerase family protein [Lacipirellulaceae bacterium]
PRRQFKFCVFEKFLQDLTYDELAEVVAEMGFVGIEATVRDGGHVQPERVRQDLPKLVNALSRRGLRIEIMATDVNDADRAVHREVLETAADLGIPRYRIRQYQYKQDEPVLAQLDALRPTVNKLADLNAQLGITGLYQNHCGKEYVGATVWDLESLIRNVPPEHIGSAFDIRHATVEAGLSWPILYELIRPHIGAVYVKDFDWADRRDQHVPLSQGRVDPRYFDLLRRDGVNGPVSLHIEYLPNASVEENLAAIRRDFAVLQKLLTT